jgi:sucrose-6-phosphate hydrolase SacC (GH32 family)
MQTIAERDLSIEHRYLLIPISKTTSPGPFGSARSNTRQLVCQVLMDGVLAHSFSLDLAQGSDDIAFWGQLDLADAVGKKATIRLAALNPASRDRYPDRPDALELITTAAQPRGAEPLYDEAARPQLRFSQMRGWNNDTNGMVYIDGEYHLFWQANPVGNTHDNMYWGHAVSRDLLHWQELPPALRPNGQGADNKHPAMADGRCHSGGGTVDHNNTGGWQSGDDKTLILAFTDTGMKQGWERVLSGFGECLAYSTDRGHSWTMFDGNPIIPHSGRDPKLFWYEPGQHWSIAAYDEDPQGNGIAFYQSTDLKQWQQSGKIYDFYECPELFQAPVQGSDKQRWCLFGADAQYLIGDFDGNTFTPEGEEKQRCLHGSVYGGQCFSNTPDGRLIYMGWARNLPTEGMPFNQGFTLPLEMTLHDSPQGLRLQAYPIAELATLRSDVLHELSDHRLSEEKKLSLNIDSDLADILITLSPDDTAERIDIELCGHTISYDIKAGRTGDIGSAFGRDETLADLALIDGALHLRLVIDRPMLECFFNHGQVYSLMPKEPGPIGQLTIRMPGTITSLVIHRLSSIWPS